MQGPWLLLVLAAGVQAFSGNGTLEDVEVSSQPLRVSAAIGYPGHDAEVRPLLRRAMTSPEMKRGRGVKVPTGSTRVNEGTKRNVKDADRNDWSIRGSGEKNENDDRLTERGRSSDEEKSKRSARIKQRTKRNVKDSEGKENKEESRPTEEGRDSDQEKSKGSAEITRVWKMDVNYPDGSTVTVGGSREENGEDRRSKERGRSSGGKEPKGSTKRGIQRDVKDPDRGVWIGHHRSSDEETGRGHMKKMKKTFKKMMPYLLVPGMMALGYAPFFLASLKMFVMNAVMLNMMAFNAAIFITLRNMVFGPRVGQHVKYYNFGYSHRKKHPHS